MKTPQPTTVSRTSVVQLLGSVSLPDEEIESFAAALRKPHPSVLRFRRDTDTTAFPFPTEPVPWYSLARRLCDDAIQPSRILDYACGDYFLQDAGSLLALAACHADGDPDATAPGKLICDLCAAPGGKASALLEMLGDAGFLIANEPIRSRIAPLSYNLARTGSDRYAVTSMDPEALADRLPGLFDLVLVDAPCSGQALLARGRQSASAMKERQIAHSAARQHRILSAATRLLRVGGQLVYSTCTFAEAENEQQVDALCRQGITRPLPIDRLEPYTSIGTGCYRLWPHRHQCAGGFAASLQLLTGNEAGQPTKRSWKRKRSDKAPPQAQQWFSLSRQPLRFNLRDAVVFAWPADAPDWIDELAIAGPELMHRTGQTWKPSHAAALHRLGRSPCLQSQEVDAQTAKEFLSGKPVDCPAAGWQVITYRNRPLGWVKSSRGTGKNQLPAAARMMGPWLC